MTTTAPSSFAALLRRSKFASYDPLIGQIYTSYGGHAHRGDWGVKRPLANRGRNSQITLQAIDTRYQQTEWKGAHTEGSLMKRWPEMAREVDLDENTGSWQKIVGAASSRWPTDTEFATISGSDEAKETVATWETPIPNVYAMSEKSFRRYLKGLRKARPQFKQFLQKQAETQAAKQNPEGYPPEPVASVDLYKQAQMPNYFHEQFIVQQTMSKSSSPESRTIVQMPHPTAALSYSHTPSLQDFYFSQPLPGRALTLPRRQNLQHRNYDVVVSGFVGELPKLDSDGMQPVDLAAIDGTSGKLHASEGVFRVGKITLDKAPIMVGPQLEGLDKVSIKMTFRSWRKGEMSRTNAHLPGSREYVAQDDGGLGKRSGWKGTPFAAGEGKSMTTHQVNLQTTEDQRKQGEDLLANLSTILNNQSSGTNRTSPPSNEDLG